MFLRCTMHSAMHPTRRHAGFERGTVAVHRVTPPGLAVPGSGTVRQVEEIMPAAGPAQVVLDRQDRPAFLLVLTHGAGGTPDTPDVLAVRDAARALGAVTALVTQPYRVRGGRAPGSAEKQDAAWAELIGVLRRATAGD